MDYSFKRVFLLVLDGVGVGALPDAGRFGDEGNNTIANISRSVGLFLPNLHSLGLGNLCDIPSVPVEPEPLGCYGMMAEKALGKDSTSGHWEMMGVIRREAPNTYPQGFPERLIRMFEERIGRKTIGNYPASGTEIIEKLGEEHLATGNPIVYTSADSVFQIAVHTDVVPLEELYGYCEVARELLYGEFLVDRVIARPFVGQLGSFQRTAQRKDYSVDPPEPTCLDLLKENGLTTLGIGKIEDLFSHRGLTESNHTRSNKDACEYLLEVLSSKDFTGLAMANLVDFDQAFGHRNNALGFRQALEEFDGYLERLMTLLKDDDLLMVTADHGNDPTTPSTDHSREYVPLICYSNEIGRKRRHGYLYQRVEIGKFPVNTRRFLGVRETFADIGETLLENFRVKRDPVGKSFLRDLLS